MATTQADPLSTELEHYWSTQPSAKAAPYVGKFFNCTRVGDKIMGKVKGNHGNYTVSIQLDNGWIDSTCSCYIGKRGNCHHCEALAATFRQNPDVFTVIEQKSVETVNEAKTLTELQAYLSQITLDDLTKQLRAKGVTQKALAESIGMNPQHITAMKSSERRNRYFMELGAMKLACMWVLENIDEQTC
ncbi:MAG: hypothetical protein AAF702_18370 [Chloroflexota bacterium]